MRDDGKSTQDGAASDEDFVDGVEESSCCDCIVDLGLRSDWCLREETGRGRQYFGTAVATVFTAPGVDESGLPPGLRNRLAELRETIKQSPTSADAPGAMGAIYYIHGFPAAAAVCFERAKELSPQTMHWWYYAGLTYEQLNENEQAIEAYQKALELDASYGALYVRLAGLLLRTDRERAEQLCQRALELNPENPTALYTLGLGREAAGDQEEAQKKFEAALEQAPNYREAHEALARVLEAAGKTTEAEQHKAAAAKGVTALSDDHLFSMLLRNGFDLGSLLHDSMLLAERGLLEEANKALGRAMEVDPRGSKRNAFWLECGCGRRNSRKQRRPIAKCWRLVRSGTKFGLSWPI